MNHIKEICSKFELCPKKYRFLGKTTIVEGEDGTNLVIKKKQKDKVELYQYLESRGFHHYPKLLEDREELEVYPYVHDVETPKEQKALDLIYLVSLLHNKTTYYKEVDLNKLKAFYEEKMDLIDYLIQYYRDLQNMIEKHVYMSPSEYQLVRHLSFFYQMLYLSKKMLQEWYSILEKKRKERQAMVHHNLSLSHFVEQDQGYLLSWDEAKMDHPIYDFYSFYQKNSVDFDYDSLLDVYQSKYPLLREEELQLFVLLSIPKKIILTHDESKTTRDIYLEQRRLKKVYQMILKKNKKDSSEENKQFN